MSVGVLAALAGCCANNVCDCQDARADALTLRFRVSENPVANPGSFAPTDVDTVYLLRFALPLPGDSGRIPHDSVRLVRPAAQAANPFIINNNAPFSPVPGRKLDRYAYTVFVRLLGSPQDKAGRKSYKLTDITLRGKLDGTGCCTCYRNTTKTAALNKQRYDLTEKDDRQPVPLELTQ